MIYPVNKMMFWEIYFILFFSLTIIFFTARLLLRRRRSGQTKKHIPAKPEAKTLPCETKKQEEYLPPAHLTIWPATSPPVFRSEHPPKKRKTEQEGITVQVTAPVEEPRSKATPTAGPATDAVKKHHQKEQRKKAGKRRKIKSALLKAKRIQANHEAKYRRGLLKHTITKLVILLNDTVPHTTLERELRKALPEIIKEHPILKLLPLHAAMQELLWIEERDSIRRGVFDENEE